MKTDKIKRALAEGKRYWIPAIGWFLFLGFFNNCVVYPFADIKVVEWSELLTALAVMLAISGVRDVGLNKQSPTSFETMIINGQSTKIAVIGKRYWIPAIGWCLAFAFLNNCGIYPYADVKIVEWAQILTGMGVLLGISGTRDIFLLRNKAFAEKIAGALFKSDGESEDKAKTETSEKS